MSGQPGLWRKLDATGGPLLVARVILGVVFIGMGWSKAWDPVLFLKLIHEYQLVPDGAYPLLNVMAVVIPWLEIVCGALLLMGRLVRGAGLTLFGLLTAFTVAIVLRGIAIHNSTGTSFCDIHFDCGCGTGDVNICRKIPENIGLWLLAAMALVSRFRRGAGAWDRGIAR